MYFLNHDLLINFFTYKLSIWLDWELWFFADNQLQNLRKELENANELIEEIKKKGTLPMYMYIKWRSVPLCVLMLSFSTTALFKDYCFIWQPPPVNMSRLCFLMQLPLVNWWILGCPSPRFTMSTCWPQKISIWRRKKLRDWTATLIQYFRYFPCQV